MSGNAATEVVKVRHCECWLSSRCGCDSKVSRKEVQVWIRDSHVKNDLTRILPKTAYKLERPLMSPFFLKYSL